MNPGEILQFSVEDYFRFSDGRIAFVGWPDRDVPWIRGWRAEFICEGKALGEFWLEGEMIPTPRPKNGPRSVSTVDPAVEELLQRCSAAQSSLVLKISVGKAA